MLKIIFKRIWKRNKDFAIYQAKINGVPVRVKYKLSTAGSMDERTLKNMLKNELYSVINLEVK